MSYKQSAKDKNFNDLVVEKYRIITLHTAICCLGCLESNIKLLITPGNKEKDCLAPFCR